MCLGRGGYESDGNAATALSGVRGPLPCVLELELAPTLMLAMVLEDGSDL